MEFTIGQAVRQINMLIIMLQLVGTVEAQSIIAPAYNSSIPDRSGGLHPNLYRVR
jgi:hypothetical protein